MLQSIKGVYKDGAIKLAETPENIEETQVIITFLEAEPKIAKQIIYFGMFTGAKQSDRGNFKIAEFCGDFDDSLDRIC